MSVPIEAESRERYRGLLEESFDQVQKTVAWVSRRLCLTGDDADEFRSWVNEKLVDDDYRVLREFKGRSSLATYLVAVIQNLGRDYRMKKWGRWRPSAAAVQLGLEAEQLEILLERDGFTLDEASEHLRSNHGVRMRHVEVVDLAAKLPARTPLRLEAEAQMAATASDSRADDGISMRERRGALEAARGVLTEVLATFAAEDRLVLRMYYQSGLTMSAIASTLGLRQRSLYTRRDRCRRALRKGLEAAGMEAAGLLEALAQSETDFRVDYSLKAAKVGQAGPSNRLNPRAKDEE